MDVQMQEPFRAPTRHDQKRTFSCQIIAKMLRVQNKETILKATREKCYITSEGKPIIMTADLSTDPTGQNSID
jgi:hypothetical protein